VNISKVYRADGDVIGYLWGGGVASYPTGLPLFRANSLEELRASIQAAIDAEHHRFGDFEALIGAVMLVTTVSTVEVEGKSYQREDSEVEIFFHPRIIPCDYEKWTETFRQMLES
jgi:hypothetical protein